MNAAALALSPADKARRIAVCHAALDLRGWRLRVVAWLAVTLSARGSLARERA